ncbi:Elongator complex protein 5 [Xylariaceae sp. FL0594]|nr:Elongator complex protein 5 [Xylariaceae sp. FL0594]
MPSSAPATTSSHARSHALLLLQKLLNLRDSASPLTLVLDTLEQSGKVVLREFAARAQLSGSKIVFISFATVRRPAYLDNGQSDAVFVRARGKVRNPAALRAEIVSHYPRPRPGSGSGSGSAGQQAQKILLIIDELNPLASAIPSDLTLFLSSLITSPSISLVSLYHVDVPLSLPPTDPYTPHPLAVVSHLATAILRVSNLHHAVERRRALNRSLRGPDYGLDEGREGVLVGLGLRTGKVAAATVAGAQGVVLEMELRRRSGRAVAETFVLVPSSLVKDSKSQQLLQATSKAAAVSKIFLLADHPAFSSADPTLAAAEARSTSEDGADEPQSTFNLNLTEKQRRDREGIVLPYFDAQSDIGAGEGGRILYEMGREDDFDDEEDEI